MTIIIYVKSTHKFALFACMFYMGENSCSLDNENGAGAD